jgi:hypothetical protein
MRHTFQNCKTGDFGQNTPKAGMAQESNPPSAMEQAVSRALRENLERLQRTSNELHQAVGDVVAACASNRPTNAIPSMLRAQTAAASLSAVLEVLSRFVAVALQPGQRSPYEAEMTRLAGIAAAEPPSAPQRPQPSIPVPMASKAQPAPVAPPRPAPELEFVTEPPAEENEPDLAAEAADAATAGAEYEGEFDVNRLTPEEQELHRRANRVAKVSMQDIKMLRPEQVRLGREKKDICIRLKDDIEKAHREYDRRFKPIMDHPVDYFYRWMVEILADGDPRALGEYPYANHARQH